MYGSKHSSNKMTQKLRHICMRLYFYFNINLFEIRNISFDVLISTPNIQRSLLQNELCCLRYSLAKSDCFGLRHFCSCLQKVRSANVSLYFVGIIPPASNKMQSITWSFQFLRYFHFKLMRQHLITFSGSVSSKCYTTYTAKKK